MKGVRQLRLTQGLYALVDARDFEYLNQWNWHASQESRKTKWYAIRWEFVNGKRVKVRMHRQVIERHHGPIAEGLVVDHTNHNSLDNRLINLEAISQPENMRRSPGWKRKGVRLVDSTRNKSAD